MPYPYLSHRGHKTIDCPVRQKSAVASNQDLSGRRIARESKTILPCGWEPNRGNTKTLKGQPQRHFLLQTSRQRRKPVLQQCLALYVQNPLSQSLLAELHSYVAAALPQPCNQQISHPQTQQMR